MPLVGCGLRDLANIPVNMKSNNHKEKTISLSSSPIFPFFGIKKKSIYEKTAILILVRDSRKRRVGMKYKLTSIFIVCLLVIGGFFALFVVSNQLNAAGPTYVSGSITSDTTWDLAGSPYIVFGHIYVAFGVTLTIEPGVEVRFDGEFGMHVNGSLIAIGTETNRINITSHITPPSPNNWKDIKINTSGHVEIKYCDISYSLSAIEIHSSNNIIINNTITNNLIGINFGSSPTNNNTISNNTFSNVRRGLNLQSSSNNTITNNNFFDEGISMGGDQLSHYNSHTIPDNNQVNGKPLYYYKDSNGINIDGIPVGELILANCTDVDVRNIQINNTDMGILGAYSSNITIENNDVLVTDMGIWFYESSNSSITNTNVKNIEKSGIVLEWSSNNTITNNDVMNVGEIGIYLVNDANTNIITNNNISESNMEGIRLKSSSNNTISNNDVSNNDKGVSFGVSSNNNIITDNIILGNNVYGAGIYQSSNKNIITGNNVIENNGTGIALFSSSNNIIYHNNIINNVIQAFDDMINNIWNDTYPSGGNYWSDFDEPSEGAYDDYQGPNQDIFGSDDIVDNGSGAGGGMNPYVIDSDSQDHYPLFKNYLFLYEGWNLISIPLIQSDTNLGNVLSSISGSYDAVQWYNVSDSNDHWKHHHILKPPIWNDLEEINHKIGFWMHITEPGGVIFEYSGIQPVLNQTITLHPGWNLVGYPSLSDKVRLDALNNINFGSDVDAIWSYDTALYKWEEMTKLDYFERCRGYWIHSKVEKIWDVPL
jgi:parallel beta-helix repeat protein